MDKKEMNEHQSKYEVISRSGITIPSRESPQGNMISYKAIGYIPADGNEAASFFGCCGVSAGDYDGYEIFGSCIHEVDGDTVRLRPHSSLLLVGKDKSTNEEIIELDVNDIEFYNYLGVRGYNQPHCMRYNGKKSVFYFYFERDKWLGLITGSYHAAVIKKQAVKSNKR